MMLSIQEPAALHPRALKAIFASSDADHSSSVADEPTGRRRHGGRWRPTTASGVATPRPHRNDTEGDEADATELARSHESLTAFLHRQALALRLSEVDSAALLS